MIRIMRICKINSKREIKKKLNNQLLFLTGVVGIEPTSKVLETSILPMNYTPILFSSSNHRLVIYITLGVYLSRENIEIIKKRKTKAKIKWEKRKIVLFIVLFF